MAAKFSTGFRNLSLGGKSLREMFSDAAIKIYSGAAPADADVAATGTLLCTLSKLGGTISEGERGIPEVWSLTFPDSHASAATYSVNVTVDGVGPTTYTYTNTPDAGDSDAVGKKIAQMLNDIPQLQAIYTKDASRTIFVATRITGLDLTLADGGGAVTFTPAKAYDGTREDTIQLGVPASGVISKESDAWQGTNIASGTAGYFRLVNSSDVGGVSTSLPRIQGSVGTSGAEINFQSVTFVIAAPTLLTAFSITQPAA